MPRSPAGPSGSVLTGGSDASDSSGGTASGTCHVCGGSLRRGKQDLARRCGECKTRFHANDCGKRRSNAGYLDSYEQCPKVREQGVLRLGFMDATTPSHETPSHAPCRHFHLVLPGRLPDRLVTKKEIFAKICQNF